MPSTLRIAGALAAPFMLAACGMPVGIQIVSLLADGVSVLTTDKTITDHGLSAVTEKDCALWRGIEGQDICRVTDDSAISLADASAAPDATVTTPKSDTEQVWGATATAQTNKNKDARRETPEFPTEEPAPAVAAPIPTPARATAAIEAAPPPPPTWAPVTTLATLPLNPVVAPTQPKPAPVPAVAKTRALPPAAGPRETYYVIASYHRVSGAERFVRRHNRLEPVILKGTAKGRQVYRVAVGPIAADGHRATKSQLKKRGFKDAWALKVKGSDVVTEVASLN